MRTTAIAFLPAIFAWKTISHFSLSAYSIPIALYFRFTQSAECFPCTILVAINWLLLWLLLICSRNIFTFQTNNKSENISDQNQVELIGEIIFCVNFVCLLPKKDEFIHRIAPYDWDNEPWRWISRSNTRRNNSNDSQCQNCPLVSWPRLLSSQPLRD